MCRALLCLFLLFWSLTASADLVFSGDFPKKLKEEIELLIKKRPVEQPFSLEVQDKNFLLIISEEGLIRRLPLAGINADDILNVIETMEEELEIIIQNKQQAKKLTLPKLDIDLEKVKQEEEARKKAEEEKKRKAEESEQQEREKVEFFSTADPDSRFYLGLFIATDEKGAGGFEFSAGVSFLRFGIGVKKGLNIKVGDDVTFAWESYHLLAQIDFMRVWDLTVSTGFEAHLYSVSPRLFDREFFYISLTYKIKFFVPAIRVKVAPVEIILKDQSESYTMSRVSAMLLLSFAF